MKIGIIETGMEQQYIAAVTSKEYNLRNAIYVVENEGFQLHPDTLK